jgi:basic amino acid/polyamine antiporter, APA family
MTAALPDNTRSQLVRAIGRWSMVALAINCILGSGIFGLPSVLAGLIGGASPLAVVLAGAAMAVIVACHAEVASRFSASGGTYLYVREAFGRLAGVEVAWLMLLGRLTALAAAVNLFVAYLGEFRADATQPLPRLALITLCIGTLALANYRGVASGTRLSNVTGVAKLATLAVVCVAGLGYLAVHGSVAPAAAPAGVAGWLKALLLLFFAYGGYEASLLPMGEADNPRRDAAFALFSALIILTVFYSLLQLIVVGVLSDAAHSARPLADATRITLGGWGAGFVALGALLSVSGFVSAHLLTGPRLTYALAEHGDFPRLFAAVHARFRTPYVSILLFALAVWAFAQFAGFSWNVTLSAVARLFYYGAVCAAVPVLRRRQPQAARFRLPGGAVLPALGVLICLTLLTQVDFSKSLILLATVAGAFLNWWLVSTRVRVS